MSFSTGEAYKVVLLDYSLLVFGLMDKISPKDFAYRAEKIPVRENDLDGALLRARMAYAGCLLELLFVEGDLPTEYQDQLKELMNGYLNAGTEGGASEKKLKDLIGFGTNFLTALWIKKEPMTPLATQVQRQKTVVEWIEKAKPSWEKGQESPKTPTLKVIVKTRSLECPILMGETNLITFHNQPENYTAAVIVWNILKDPRSLIEELGPYLHLYEARKDLKSFRSVQPSKEIGKLYRKGRDADPMIYVVDDRKRYVVATLLERKDERDEGEAKKGIVLSLNAASLQESINEAKVHVDLQGKLDFRVNGFLATRLLPLSTSLTEQNPDLIAFSSDYDIILYPPQQQGQDGTGGSSLASHKRSRFKSLIKRVFRI